MKIKVTKNPPNDIAEGIGCFMVLLGIALIILAFGIFLSIPDIIKHWK